MRPTVTIDCFPESLPNYRDGWAVVAVDVIRATTTAVTAASQGRRVFPVPSLDRATSLATCLDNPLLVGELGGTKPAAFHLNNSPAALSQRADFSRPMILLSSGGTRVICEAGPCQAVYAACLRNHSAQSKYLLGRYERIAIVGAGAQGEFREEDQLCCAWIAEPLLDAGYKPSTGTMDIVARWRGARIEELVASKSVEYLRVTDQLDDLDFILNHLDDVPAVVAFNGIELITPPFKAPVSAIGAPL